MSSLTSTEKRRLEDLLRRWVDVAHRYSEAALVLRKEIHAVVQHTEQAANTISSSFQAVINKYLSEDEIDALATMNEVLFDALCPAGDRLYSGDASGRLREVK